MPSSPSLQGALCALALLAAPPALAEGRAAPVDSALAERLLARFAPLVILAPGERALPANVDWYLSRARLDPEPLRELSQPVTQASLLGDWDALLREMGRQAAR